MTDACLSVVIPVKNRSKDLKQCLEALQKSSLKPLEIIVVDDNSDDDSGNVAKSFGCRVIRNETTLGTSASRNRGAKAAEGEIVSFIDSDVLVMPDTLEKLVNSLQNSPPEIKGVNGHYTEKLPAGYGQVSCFANLSIWFQLANHPDCVNTLFTAICIVQADFFRSIGSFIEEFRDVHCDDVAIQFQLPGAGPYFCWCRDALAVHLKKYKLVDYFWNRFGIGKSFITLARFAIGEGKRGRGKLFQHHRYPLNTLLTALIIANLAVGMFFPQSLWFLLILFSGIIINNARFIKHFLEQVPISGIIFIVPLLLVESAGYLLGLVAGLFKLRKLKGY